LLALFDQVDLGKNPVKNPAKPASRTPVKKT
jgi:hypothetical protein